MKHFQQSQKAKKLLSSVLSFCMIVGFSSCQTKKESGVDRGAEPVAFAVSTFMPYADPNYEGILQEAVEAGFTHCDFQICDLWDQPELESQYYENLEQYLDKFKATGMYLNSIHISFGENWDPSTLDETKRTEIVDKIIKVIDRIDKYDPYGYNIHGSFEPVTTFDFFRADRINCVVKSFQEICDSTVNYVCIENLPRTCLGNTAAEMLDIAERVDRENMGVCFDTNHFLQEDPADAVLVLGKYIKMLHVSDYDGVDERHWMPMSNEECIIDWARLIYNLKQVGYKGTFGYEANRVPSQIMENYRLLMALDYEPTIIP